jgi:uncharacterized protein
MKIKNIAVLIVCIIFVAISQSLSLKANIGVCACWDSVSMNIYEQFGIKVGTVSIIINCSLVAVQFLLQRKEFRPIKIMQVPLAILSGVIVNIMYYNVLTFEADSYAFRVVLLLLSYIGLAIFVGAMTALDIITMPLESLCYAIEKKYGIAFSKLRMAADFICIAASLAMSLVFGLSLKVREGTIIGFFLLGPLMGLCMKFERKLFSGSIFSVDSDDKTEPVK